jgi:exportin-T
LLVELSGEVADTILKGARDFTEDRHRRDGVVRDYIRDRDSKDISDAVLTIISDIEARLVAVRNDKEGGITSPMEEQIALALRAFASLIRTFSPYFLR